MNVYCSELASVLVNEPRLAASAVRHSGDIYASYRMDQVEGTSLVYTGTGGYSTHTKASWWDYTLEVLLVNFDDDWIGVSFRYIDDNNYYRFEMNAQERIRRLKRRRNGVVTILWSDALAGYIPATLYMLRIELIRDRAALGFS